MPIPRYERQLDEVASPGFSRGLIKLYLIGALIGLLAGTVWVIAGLLYFHPLW